MVLIPGKNLRRNILDLKENYPKEFGRFIIALRNLEESDDWPRICGIHGNTFKANDIGVKCPTDPSTVEKIGNTPDEPFYCAHSETRFVAWHTPYVYQYELLLNKYNTTDDKSYISLPYLFLTNEDNDFSFINEPKIEITLNDDSKMTMTNPLAAENVVYYNEKGEQNIVRRNGFLKPTDSSEALKVRTTNKELNNVMYAENYPTFSSNNLYTEHVKELIDFNPLEIPHNNIHDFIGGEGGNMSEVSISAYDPLFWLHHCNIDRFFYNWLYTKTDGFKNAFTPPQIPADTLIKTLAPFYDGNVYKSEYENYFYGWQNGSLDFLKLKDILNFQEYPYTYEKIDVKPYEVSKTSLEISGMPIPLESTHIEAFLHPKHVALTAENKKDYLAGSATWFGINRYTKSCKRCNKSRTNLKIDLQDYMSDKNIKIEDLKKYKWSIEGKGRLHKHEDNNFKTYSQEEIIKDGSVDLFTYHPYDASKLGSSSYWSFMKGVANVLGLRTRGGSK